MVAYIACFDRNTTPLYAFTTQTPCRQHRHRCIDLRNKTGAAFMVLTERELDPALMEVLRKTRAERRIEKLDQMDSDDESV
jgi:hypothetical protein